MVRNCILASVSQATACQWSAEDSTDTIPGVVDIVDSSSILIFLALHHTSFMVCGYFAPMTSNSVLGRSASDGKSYVPSS